MKLIAGSLAVILAIAAGSAGAREQVEAPEPGTSGGEQQDSQTMSGNDQWACEVAMCMSNPDGKTAVEECKPPIEKMLEELAKGEKIPHCKFLGGDSSGGGSGGGKDDGDGRPQQQR